MSSQPADEILHIIFTEDDVYAMAEDLGVSLNVAGERVREWAPYIETTVVSLINVQLASVIAVGAP